MKNNRNEKGQFVKGTYILNQYLKIDETTMQCICANGNKFLFDLEDYDLIKGFNWNINKHGYAHTYIEGKYYKFHRLVMGVQFDGTKIIDHINRIRTDNRKINLRICLEGENIANSTKPKNNKSGIIGVCKSTNGDKWRVSIQKNKKRQQIGVFNDFYDAVVCRLKAERDIFGEFAPQRHLFKEYGIETTNPFNPFIRK